MVRQFADPYAFVRELVQNSIDAGCTCVRARLTHDDAGRALTAVEDDGCGMSRDDIESCLLTLFASSKEKAEGKIGKYGIGFMSVLGVDPEEVVVETWRSDGSFLVRLYANQRYVLERGMPYEGTGTRVTLSRSMDSGAFEQHATAVRTSLRRWCRHAAVPVTMAVQRGRRASTEERLDEPFDFIAPVKVREAEGEEAVVVGCEAGCAFLPDPASSPEGVARFAGFYNRGLTLLETTDETFPGLEGLRWKVMSPTLRHTLSRDNVKRDDAFERMLGKARALAKLLPKEVGARMQQVAERVSRDGWSPRDRAVLVAALVHLRADKVVLPLVEPFDGKQSLPAGDVRNATHDKEPCLLASESDALTKALAAHGRVIVRGDPEGEGQPSGTNQLIATLLHPRGVVQAHARYLVADAAEPADATELALCDALKAALATAGAAVAEVGWMTGAPITATSILVDDAKQSPLIVLRSSIGSPKADRELQHGHLLLGRDDPVARIALSQAKRGHAELAALLLTRIVLLEHRGAIGPDANQALLMASLAAGARVEGGTA